MEGPAFSTRAESNLYRSWGADLINMSVLPEAKLAREAEIPYTMICMSTDYDSWKADETPVTVEVVMANISANSENAKRLVSAVIPAIEDALEKGTLKCIDKLKGTMNACITSPEKRDPMAIQKLSFLLPGYFDIDKTN